jgi:hypothetical protein
MQPLLEVELHDPSNNIDMQKRSVTRDWTILIEGEDQYMVSQQVGATSIHFTVPSARRKMHAQLLGTLQVSECVDTCGCRHMRVSH